MQSLRCTPRYFTLVIGLIFWPLTLKLRCLVLSLLLEIIISVLLTLRGISLLCNH